MKKCTATFVLIYGILLFLGGIMGFVKAQSLFSLVFGFILGTGVILSALAMYKKKKEGTYAALTIAFAVDALFTYRMIATGKVFPAGVICLLSLAVIIALAVSLKKTK